MTTTVNAAPHLVETLGELQVGARVRFTPGSGSRRWWTVRARNDRFIVATRPADFRKAGELFYTVVDLVGWQYKRYNGAGNGVVRSSLNTLGGGWDIGPDGEGAQSALDALERGEFELSRRRVLDVREVDVAPMTTHKADG